MTARISRSGTSSYAAMESGKSSSSAIDDVISSLRDINSPRYMLVQLGIFCVAATAAWWAMVILLVDDYNNYCPYIPFSPFLFYLTVLWVMSAVNVFTQEKRIVASAPSAVQGFEKLFTVDVGGSLITFFLVTWATLMIVIAIGYTTYWHYHFHVLSPAFMWSSVSGMFLVLLVSNTIRRMRGSS